MLPGAPGGQGLGAGTQQEHHQWLSAVHGLSQSCRNFPEKLSMLNVKGQKGKGQAG